MKLQIYFYDEDQKRPYVIIDGFKVPVKNGKIFYGYNYSRNIIDPARLMNKKTGKVHPIKLSDYENEPEKFVFVYEYERRN